jgi:orotidine-5'-phosphate decarboxylase
MTPATRDKLIVALDVPEYDPARELVEHLGDEVSFYKIGLELVFSGGLDLAQELKNEGKRVFLDMKLLDIGNTVERAVATAAGLGVEFLTIHGHDRKTLAAAVRGRGSSQLKILAVTVLTSLDANDLAEQGASMAPADLVLHRARMAHEAGIDGVIASGQEAARVRAATSPDFLIVTPGIRLPGEEAGDQTRITTPQQALRDGANHLVVGRPINAAPDPVAAARTFLEQIAAV